MSHIPETRAGLRVRVADAGTVLGVRADWSAMAGLKLGVVGPHPEGAECAVEVRAFVALGGLTPDDVDVQVVAGTPDTNDELKETSLTSMTATETYDDGRARYDAVVPLDQSGAFGYTVRVVPRNDNLASVAELNLVALPA